MTGLREVRQELKAIRVRAMSAAGGLVVIEAADGLPQASIDAFLDEQLGPDRSRVDVVVLRRFADERKAPRIVSRSNESLRETLQAIDGKSRGLPSEREKARRATV